MSNKIKTNKVTFKSIYLIPLLVCITLFTLQSLHVKVEAKEQITVESPAQQILAPALLVCGDGTEFKFHIELLPSGEYVYHNQLTDNSYDSGSGLADSYGCLNNYKIYIIQAYALFLDCGPSGEFRNGGMFMSEHDSSPTTTVSLPSTIWVVSTGYHTGTYASLGEYKATHPYNCDAPPCIRCETVGNEES